MSIKVNIQCCFQQLIYILVISLVSLQKHENLFFFGLRKRRRSRFYNMFFYFRALFLMLLKKKKLYCKNIMSVRPGCVHSLVTGRLLLKTWTYNMQCLPLTRLVLSSEEFYGSDIRTFSRVKLRCLITASRRVPARRYMLSRFFLCKYVDSLHVSSLIKK